MPGRMSRREVLKRGAVDAAGLTVMPALLVACGNASPTPAASAAAASSPEATAQPTPDPLGVVEKDGRVVFYKTGLAVINYQGVLLDLVAQDGGTGIRFYKDFTYGHEDDRDHPWSLWIEGKPKGYEGFSLIRDWAFTAALWDADGKLTVGRLHPHPPANPPADARFHVRGTLDEAQARIDGITGQGADILEVTSANGLDAASPATPRLAVRGDGATVLGSPEAPTALVLHDTATGRPYAITVENGRLVATRVGG
jgi:hypothetical protein